jgi:hypothetical protein
MDRSILSVIVSSIDRATAAADRSRPTSRTEEKKRMGCRIYSIKAERR